QQGEGGAVTALHAPDQLLVQVLSLLCVHDFGHRAGTPWGPGLAAGRCDMGVRRKVPRGHRAGSGAGWRLPQAMPAGKGVSSADLTPIAHHLDDNGPPGTVTDHAHACRARPT